MKLRLLPFFLAFVMLMVTASPPVRALPNSQDIGVALTATAAANLRAGPGITYARIGGVPMGATVRVVSCNSDCSWYKTAEGSWILAELLAGSAGVLPRIEEVPVPGIDEGNNTNPLALATPTPASLLAGNAEPTVKPTNNPEITRSASNLPMANANANLRAGPGTDFARVGSVKAGDTLDLVGQTEAGDWLQLADESWIAAFLVENLDSDLPVIDKLPSPPVNAGSSPAVVTPTPQPSSASTQRAPDLVVDYINPHYNCELTEYVYRAEDGTEQRIWTYRSFQVDMFITNNGTEPVEAPWAPTRWIITDGTNEMINDLVWQWGRVDAGAYQQPNIYPGQTVGWTWAAMPVGENEWVKAVEYYYKGRLYRKEFDLGQYHNAYNYVRCGDYVPAHRDFPTPTPHPLWGN